MDNLFTSHSFLPSSVTGLLQTSISLARSALSYGLSRLSEGCLTENATAGSNEFAALQFSISDTVLLKSPLMANKSFICSKLTLFIGTTIVGEDEDCSAS